MSSILDIEISANMAWNHQFLILRFLRIWHGNHKENVTLRWQNIKKEIEKKINKRNPTIKKMIY